MTEELYSRVCQLVNLGVKCMCGKRLYRNHMQMYPHEGGISVPKKEGLQWVYVECRHCQYQNSWRKILKSGEHLYD